MKKKERKKSKGLLLQEWLLLITAIIGLMIVIYGSYLQMADPVVPPYIITIIGTFLFIPVLLIIMLIAEKIINGWIKLRDKNKLK